MKLTADCPNCATEIEVLSMLHANAGIRCPKCDVGFVPENVKQVHTTQEETENIRQERAVKWHEYDSLKNNAVMCLMLGMLLLAICGISIVIGFAGDSGNTPFVISGGAFSLAATLFFLSQCFHIRAGLEKLSLKE